MNTFVKRNQIIILSIVFCLFSLHMALTGEKRQAGGELIIGKVLSAIASPFQTVFLGSYNALGNVVGDYVYLVGLKEENEAQGQTISRLIEENSRLKEKLDEKERLTGLIEMKRSFAFDTIAARVTAFNLGGWTKTIQLDSGLKEGIAEDMPIISTEGVVGRVIETSGGNSLALLITDPRSNIDVIVQRTRVRGIAEGRGSNLLGLKYIRDLEDIKVGDLVVTAGLSGIFPKGLVVGHVASAQKSGDNFFKSIEIRPSALLGRLEEVLAVKTDITDSKVVTE